MQNENGSQHHSYDAVLTKRIESRGGGVGNYKAAVDLLLLFFGCLHLCSKLDKSDKLDQPEDAQVCACAQGVRARAC